MIEFENQYLKFIEDKGVGAKDKVEGASPRSYVSYLNSVSKILKLTISPKTMKNDTDVSNFLIKLKDTRKDNTIKNYGSALKRYAEMVQELNLY